MTGQPRVVRPAHLVLRGTGVTSKTFSPIRKDGVIDADLTVRTPAGKVSPVINIKAGTFNRDGRIDVQLNIPKGFTVDVIRGTSKAADGMTWVSITPEEES